MPIPHTYTADEQAKLQRLINDACDDDPGEAGEIIAAQEAVAQTKTLSASQLRDLIEDANPDTHYFDRDTMRFFGDTMRNLGVRHCRIRTWSGEDVDAWELFRRRPVTRGLGSSSYWDAETFRQVYGEVID